MLVAERQKKIVDLINKKKSIKVSELSDYFSVTEETIRRDLEKLENEKKLLRSHGGAVTLDFKLEVPYQERKVAYVDEKVEISKLALNQINEGDKIILDASTTAWYLAKNLPNIPLTVITNSINVEQEIVSKTNILVISIGGILVPQSLSHVGPLAENSLSNYYADKAFISCKSFDLTYGLTESTEEQALIKQKMIECSNDVFLMINHQKIGKRSFSKIGNVNKIDHLIIDHNVSEQTKINLKKQNINIIN